MDTVLIAPPVNGGHHVSTIVQATALEAVRSRTANVIPVFMENGGFFATTLVFQSTVHIAISKQVNVRDARMAIGTRSVKVDAR